MSMKMLGPFLLLLGACGGPDYQYNGQDIYKYFPLDGDRDWEYASDDVNMGWSLYVELTGTSMIEDTVVSTLEYQQKGGENEVGEPLFSVQWSSDSSTGVQIHSYTDLSGTGETTYFTPPVVFAEHQMNVGDTVDTQSNGMSFTSTFAASTDCNTHWSTDTWECLHFILDDGDGDNTSGMPFAGEWWIATNWGAAQLRPTGYTDTWVLTEANFGDAK